MGRMVVHSSPGARRRGRLVVAVVEGVGFASVQRADGVDGVTVLGTPAGVLQVGYGQRPGRGLSSSLPWQPTEPRVLSVHPFYILSSTFTLSEHASYWLILFPSLRSSEGGGSRALPRRWGWRPMRFAPPFRTAASWTNPVASRLMPTGCTLRKETARAATRGAARGAAQQAVVTSCVTSCPASACV